MSIFDALKDMDTQYQQTNAAAAGKVPDGKYCAICKEARLLEATGTKPITLSTSWIIMEGDYKGRMLFISHRVVANETAYAYLKRFLKDLQVQASSLTQLPDVLEDFTGRMIVASVVTRKSDVRYSDVYIDKYIGKGDVEPYLKKEGQQTSGQNDDFQVIDAVDDLPFD